jgi:hypothetical protein
MVMLLCFFVVVQMLGVPVTLLNPVEAADTLAASALEGFCVPSSLPQLNPSAETHPVTGWCSTIRACAGSHLYAVSSSCSLVPFPCSTPQRHFSCERARGLPFPFVFEGRLLLRQVETLFHLSFI